uniref:asparagine synthase-related protein n=2 Tax=Gammaproteobacteria TaxID=1236 RepID=UPI0019541F62
LLAEARLRRHDLLDPVAVQACWEEHLAGRRDRSRALWAALMFQAWLDEASAPSPPAATDEFEPELQGS